MIRYVAFLWDRGDALATQTAKQMARRFTDCHCRLSSCCSIPGMIVFAGAQGDDGHRIYALPKGHGVILGRVFPMKAEHWRAGWCAAFSEADAARFASTAGTAFVHDYWGAYVAFICNPTNGDAHVIRDCSGKIPCYATTHRDILVVFGDINNLGGLGLAQFEIDVQYLSAFIYWPELQVNQCALKGVTELLAGQRLQQKHGAPAVSNAWDPCEVVRSGVIDSVITARSALRSVTEYCIAAWASTYERVLHSLSGGLDSAIVLGCLSRVEARPLVTCINRYHPVPGEDERSYAKRAAELAHCEFIELPWCPANRTFEPSLLAFPRCPKPFNPLPYSLLAAESLSAVADDYHAQTVWTGEGGDHIFFNYVTALGAADYMRVHPVIWSPQLMSAIVDAARYSKEPYLNVWRDATRLATSRTHWKSPLQAARTNGCRISFLEYELLPKHLEQYLSHPWSSHRDDLPKGKQLQIELLSELLNRDRISTLLPPPAQHPLISQPLLELSLRIPIYLLTAGGRQRALAREVFKDVVPPEILAREDKGTTHRLWITKIRDSQPFIRDLLLNGWLVSEGIIDRPSLEPYLSARQPIRPEQCSPLTACIAAEMWARSWLTPVQTPRCAARSAEGEGG